jgi:MoaA/NifB/PqqE/SkfB family radical SAM enzyme
LINLKIIYFINILNYLRQIEQLCGNLLGKCNLNCKHCLRNRYDKPINELSDEDTIKVFSDYINFHKNNNQQFNITFSGGNPLLKPCFFTLMYMSKEAKEKNICKYTNILGNTDTIDNKTLDVFNECKLDSFFVSLDGLKKSNDFQRGIGNYDNNIRTIPKLINIGTIVKIKYTLSKISQYDIVKVLDMTLNMGISTFAIGLLNVHDDKIKNYISSINLTPFEHRRVALNLLNYLDNDLQPKYNFVKNQILKYNKTAYAILFKELNRLDEYITWLNTDINLLNIQPNTPFNNKHNLFKGVIWEDGSVHLGNRSPSTIIGYVPKQSFQEIYDKNKDIINDFKYYKHDKKINEKCSHCDLTNICGHDLNVCWK